MNDIAELLPGACSDDWLNGGTGRTAERITPAGNYIEYCAKCGKRIRLIEVDAHTMRFVHWKKKR